MKIYKYLFTLCIILLLLPSTQALNAESTNSQDMFGIVLPNLSVHNLTVEIDNPEEGLSIPLTVYIQNNDSIAYNEDIMFHIKLKELQLGHPDPSADLEEKIVLNYTLNNIGADKISEIPVEIYAEAGQWTMTAYISFNNTIIPSSIFVGVLQVLSLPIGDLDELIFSVEVIIGFIFIVIFMPSIIDNIRKIRYKKKLNT